MLSSPHLSALAFALLVSGCYSGVDLDDGLTGLPGISASSSGPGASSTGESDPTEGGGGTDSAGSMSASGADTGDTTEDATTAPAATTGGPTTDPNPTATSDPDTTTTDPTVGTTTTDPSTTTTTDPDTTTTTDPSTTSTTGDPNPDVPDGVPYCVPAAMWDPGWKQLEEDILAQVNQVRAQGASCGSEGAFGPAGPLTMEPALRCAARMHSKDMSDRDFFSHTNPDNESPWDRMDKAGYGNYSNAGENIAAGSPDAAGTMEQWMTSDGHCANIMNPSFKHIGVGYHTGGQWGHLWTQVFGAK